MVDELTIIIGLPMSSEEEHQNNNRSDSTNSDGIAEVYCNFICNTVVEPAYVWVYCTRTWELICNDSGMFHLEV